MFHHFEIALEVLFFDFYYLITSILEGGFSLCHIYCIIGNVTLRIWSFSRKTDTRVTVACVDKCQLCVLISRRIATLDVLNTFPFEENWTWTQLSWPIWSLAGEMMDLIQCLVNLIKISIIMMLWIVCKCTDLMLMRNLLNIGRSYRLFISGVSKMSYLCRNRNRYGNSKAQHNNTLIFNYTISSKMLINGDI